MVRIVARTLWPRSFCVAICLGMQIVICCLAATAQHAPSIIAICIAPHGASILQCMQLGLLLQQPGSWTAQMHLGLRGYKRLLRSLHGSLQPLHLRAQRPHLLLRRWRTLQQHARGALSDAASETSTAHLAATPGARCILSGISAACEPACLTSWSSAPKSAADSISAA